MKAVLSSKGRDASSELNVYRQRTAYNDDDDDDDDVDDDDDDDDDDDGIWSCFTASSGSDFLKALATL
ncbi:hypothetical protein PoB_001716100 [Plakobranchus ocellatus]|uniref:Uncharacterized protein n=1 Tax=Plakobranchus ocellatus TaxID=259542 RepID=A0AAV3Z7R3_9GAST|nr:hypothetical protein PoB_001716100 [Plakobranchus ocellatus]